MTKVLITRTVGVAGKGIGVRNLEFHMKEMKEMIYQPLRTFILLGLILPVTAGVQITNRISFSTSFPFTVGNTKFPPGSYSIRPLDDDEEIMEITTADGKTSAMFEIMMAEMPKTPAKGEVVFKKYGENYVLSEIYEPGSKIGVMTVKTHAERQQAKKYGTPSKESVATMKANP
jgi:hypothetical protein